MVRSFPLGAPDGGKTPRPSAQRPVLTLHVEPLPHMLEASKAGAPMFLVLKTLPSPIQPSPSIDGEESLRSILRCSPDISEPERGGA